MKAVTGFFDYLASKNYQLGWWEDEGASYGPVYDFDFMAAFSDFFGIDFDKADKEREDNAKAVKD
jgi:hypothetical protein